MDKNNVAISIIIPVYNVEEYLEDCLKSILVQSFKDYEIICINDASIDASKKILEQYKQKYNRIKVINHLQNKGLSASRNLGVKIAQGKYILFLDSDDMFAHEDVLKELFVRAEENLLDMIYFGLEKRSTAEMKMIKKENYIKESIICSGRELFCLGVEERTLIASACIQFCRKDFLEKNGFTFYEGILHEDMLYFFYCIMAAKRVQRIENIYYLYRQREHSIMTTYNKERAQSVYVILSELYSYWISHDFSEREHKAIEWYFTLLYHQYKKYQYFEPDNWKLECGNYAEKCLYQLLQEENKVLFTAEQIRKILDKEYVIVYGAGGVALNVINFLKKLEITIHYVAVTDKKRNEKNFCGIEVKEITELQNLKEKAVIVVSVSNKFIHEVLSNLKSLEFLNIVTMKNDAKKEGRI